MVSTGSWKVHSTHEYAQDFDISEAGKLLLPTTRGLKSTTLYHAPQADNMVPVGSGAVMNVANGDFALTIPLFTTNGVGPQTSLNLTYRTMSTVFGRTQKIERIPGWQLQPSLHLVYDGANNAWLESEDGVTPFVPIAPGSNTYEADQTFDQFRKLTRDPTTKTWTLEEMDGTKHTFLATGQLSETKDSSNNVLRYVYDAAGNIDKIVDTTNRETDFQYANDLLQHLIDPAGRQYTFVFYALGDPEGSKEQRFLRAATRENPVGNETWFFAYHQATNPNAICDDGSPCPTKRGFLKSVNNPRGLTTSFYYDTQGRFRTTVSPLHTATNPHVLKAMYQQLGSQANSPCPPPEPPTPTMTVDELDLQTQITDWRGFTTEYETNFQDATVWKIIDPLNGTPSGGTIEQSFDTFRRLRCTKDKRDFKTIYDWIENPDTGGFVKHLLQTIDPPDGPSNPVPPILYDYTDPNVSHLVTRITDSNGSSTDYDHNDPNNPYVVTTIREPSDDGMSPRPETIMTYDAQGRLRTRRDPNANTTTYNYNDLATGLVTSIDRPGITGNEVMTYNVMGQTLTHKQPAHTSGVITTYEYDQTHRLKKTTFPATTDHGATNISNTYDRNGNLLTMTDQLGKVTIYEYDILDRRTKTTRHDGTFLRIEYDPNGNVTDTYDFNNNRTQFEYDALNRAIKERRFETVNNQHLKFGYEYDANGNRTKVHELNIGDETIHSTTNYQYDQLNRLIRTTYPATTDHPAANVINSYDANSNLLTVRDERTTPANVTRNCYTNRNLLKATKRTGGDVDISCSDPAYRTDSTYDLNGNRLTMSVQREDPDNPGSWQPKTTTHQYDAVNRLTRTTDPENRPTITEYDDNGNVTLATDPSNMKTKTEYDTLNRQKRVISDYTRKNLTTTTVYNQVGSMLNTTDANGRITRNTYDNLHRLIQVTMPDLTKTKYTYDANGNRKTVVDANNNTTTYTYDGLNRVIREQDLLGKRTETTYDEFGNVIRRVQTDGTTSKQTDYLYDALHRLKVTIYADATPDVTRTYDAAGNLKTITDTNTNHSFEYDSLNRMTVDQDNKVNRKLVYTFDSFDQRRTMEQWRLPTHPSGSMQERVFDYRYDNAGQLDTITTGADVYNFDHNTDGTRQRLTRPNGAYTQYSYDTAKRLGNLNNRKPDNSVVSGFGYQYDNVGNRTRMDVTQDGSLNHTIQYTYDSLDRLKTETRTGTNVYALAWGYDAVGNRLSETRNGVPTTYGYNTGNELTKTNVPGPQIITDDFNAPPLTDKWTVQSGTWSEANGELTSSDTSARSLITSTASSQTNFTASVMVKLSTNWQGLAFHIQNPQNYLFVEITQKSSGGGGGPRRIPADDATLGSGQSAFTAQTTTESTTPVTTSATIGTTPVQAQIKIMRIANGALSQLASANVTGTKTWTKLGIYVTGNTVNILVNNENKLVKSGLPYSSGTIGLTTEKYGTFDDFNLTELNIQTTSSDERGNATVGDVNTYDTENRLIHFVQGTMTVDYTYDAFGRRIKKRVNDNGNVTEERYYYDGDDVLLDLDGSGNIILRSYVNGLGIDEKLTVEQGGSRAFFLTDALGSTRELIDTGNVVQTRLSYEAFGKTTPVVENLVNRYQFTGREKDAEVPLMYYRARMYDQNTGRFTGRDAIGIQEKDWNLYQYSRSNPINFLDPLGLETKEVWVERAIRKIGIDPEKNATGEHPLDVNKKISSAYAEMYLKNPNLFKWAGMAAFASTQVGEYMTQMHDVLQQSIDKWGAVLVVTFIYQQFEALRLGNYWVYEDVYWQHLAYSEKGLDELRSNYKEGKLDKRAFNAWKKIDDGRIFMESGKTAKGQDLVWEGNEELLKYEQEEVLQKYIYNRIARETWEMLSPQVKSHPLLGDKYDFSDLVPGGNFGVFEDRWKWMKEGVVPAWRALEQKSPEKIIQELRKIHKIQK